MDLDAGGPRFLRAPQLRALETYWYLRLVEGTPHVLDLYRRLYPATTEFLEALGLGQPQLQRMALDDGVDALLERVRTDDELVRDYKLESVRETPQLGFTVWRVNDYDLQIQHNEAVELACEHIGIERSRTDGFFDGTLGKRLVKIVPFGHPLSPVDLEEVKRELEARPEEDRDIVMVCLGKELAADSWLEEWNQLRRVRGGAPNRIEVIELRSDPKYGKFIAHRPAEARVQIRREKKKIVIEVQDFISPSIVERLDVDVPLFRAKIPDWRSMVDCVMIDVAHDGAVFNVTLSDVPEKRDDLVAGRYELPAPKGKTTVAVKIIDMLGEEVVVTARV
jgi:hypothetical protein